MFLEKSMFSNFDQKIFFSVCMLYTWIYIQKYFNMMLNLYLSMSYFRKKNNGQSFSLKILPKKIRLI
jgi:hypothetical protein